MHRLIEISDHNTWLNTRGKGIGGSDVACLFGLNPNKSNVDLWREKTGRTKPQDISNNPCVIYGKKAEDYLRELFILDYPEYEVTHDPYNILVHKDYDFIRGSLDGQLKHKITLEKGILEVKTTEIKRSTDWNRWDKKIPMNYFCQILHYFAIDEDFKFAKLKAQIKHTDIHNNITLTTRHYPIQRADHLSDIDMVINKEIEFWHYIETDKEPPLILPNI